MWLTRRGSARGVARWRPAAVFPQLEPLEARCLPSFTGAARSFDAGTGPASVVVGDFNGDGILDLAVVDQGSYPKYDGSVSVLLGNGDGAFQPARSFAVGTHPVSVALGDFNGDGTLDLAVVNEGSYPNYTDSSVSVLLGHGDGTFQPARTLAAGFQARSVAVGDFNGDGTLDLAVADYGSRSVSVLLGNGDGIFQSAQSFAAGSFPIAVAVGDFNGDGVQDLAVANFFAYSGTVSLLRGNGDGSFQAPVPFDVGFAPDSVAVADFNGDGIPDLAVANSAEFGGTHSVSILLGQGDGTFQTTSTTNVGLVPEGLAVGDFNGDGIPDLAVNVYADNVVRVLMGNGDGSFQAALNVPVGDSYASAGAVAVAVGDFNGDGHLDLVSANGFDDTVSVVLGNGDGSFQGAPRFPAGSSPRSVAVGDFNGDGIPDLAVADRGSNDVSVLLGNGDSTFRRPASYFAGYGPDAVVVGDFNGDGIPDLAVADYNGYPNGSVSVLLGRGNGSFGPPTSYVVGIEPSALAVGDFNGDGHLDLVVTAGFPGAAQVLLGNGDGTFRAYTSYAAGVDPYELAVADFNGDGKPDIVVSDYGDGHSNGTGISVLVGNGDGTFQAPRILPFGSVPGPLAVGDFNGDGIPDLAVPIGYGGEMGVLLGNGDGTFQVPRVFSVGGGFFGAGPEAVGDFNGDGIPDLAVFQGEGVKVLLGNGDGTFQGSPVSYVAGEDRYAVAAADFNGDGQPDLAVVNLASNDVSVLLNDGAWPTGAAPGLARQPTVTGGAPQAALAARLAVPEPRPVGPAPTAGPEQAAEPRGPRPTEADRSLLAAPAGMPTPAPRVWVRSARGTRLGEWGDPLEDLWATGLLPPGRA